MLKSSDLNLTKQKSLKSLNLTNGYPNKNKKKKNNNNKVKSKPLELFELAGKNCPILGNFDILSLNITAPKVIL
jgi:hypothetical protein